MDRRGGHSLSVKAGEQRVSIDDAKGARELAFTVRPKEYAAQRITLKNPRQVNPSDEDMKRIEREMAEQSAANRSYRAGVTPSNLILDRPVPGGRLSSPFCGASSTAKSAIRIPGWISPPAGTPIKAPAAGVVTLVGDYFFNGKTVFLDHGQGMVSMFCHMSAIDVKVGTRCRAAGGGQGGRHGPRHGAAPALERQPERCAGRSRDLHRRLQALIVAAQAAAALNRPARIRSGLAGPRVLQRDPVQRVLVHAFGVEHLFVELQQFGFLFVQAVVELDLGVGVGQPGVAQAVDESLARLAEQAQAIFALANFLRARSS